MKCSMPLVALTLFLFSTAAKAEFYVWRDEQGVKHVSNIPRECITEYKTVNPLCMVFVPDGTGGQPERSVAHMSRSEAQKAQSDEDEGGNIYADVLKGLAQNKPKNQGTGFVQSQVNLGLALAAIKAERADKIRREYLKAGVRPPDKIVARPSLVAPSPQIWGPQDKMARDIEDMKSQMKREAFNRKLGLDY